MRTTRHLGDENAPKEVPIPSGSMGGSKSVTIEHLDGAEEAQHRREASGMRRRSFLTAETG